MNSVGGRKFVLTVLALASATWLVAMGHIADGVYSAVVMSTVGVYIAANVVQKSQEAKPWAVSETSPSRPL
ncbi:MAG: hypothetical protein Q8N51_05750 [Gammaproteobacteria bacterium]|nr:hypothetical protein [Gammaproteobacteria bacterium]